MPEGVNSPVRAFKSVGGQPIVIDSVKGSHMRDIDGNNYVDYVGSWGPAIIGHTNDEGDYGDGGSSRTRVSSRDPHAMIAGIHTLKRLQGAGSYDYLDKVTSQLIEGILDAGKMCGHATCGGHFSGMFGFFPLTDGLVDNFEDAKKSDTGKFGKFYRGMLEEGVYLAPSRFEAGFTSLAHSYEDIQRTVDAAENVLRQL